METTFVTQPGVIAVLLRWHTDHSAGPVTHNNDEIYRTPTPTPQAAGKEMSDLYSLHILLPEQRCYIQGRSEVRFFHQRESAPSTSEPATAKVPISERLITLPSIGQPEGSVPMRRSVHASDPKLLTLEPPVTFDTLILQVTQLIQAPPESTETHERYESDPIEAMNLFEDSRRGKAERENVSAARSMRQGHTFCC